MPTRQTPPPQVPEPSQDPQAPEERSRAVQVIRRLPVAVVPLAVVVAAVDGGAPRVISIAVAVWSIVSSVIAGLIRADLASEPAEREYLMTILKPEKRKPRRSS